MDKEYGFGNIMPTFSVFISEYPRIFPPPENEIFYVFAAKYNLPLSKDLEYYFENPNFWEAYKERAYYNRKIGGIVRLPTLLFLYPKEPFPPGKVILDLKFKMPYPIRLEAVRFRTPIKGSKDWCYHTYYPYMEIGGRFWWKTKESSSFSSDYLGIRDYDSSSLDQKKSIKDAYVADVTINQYMEGICLEDTD